MSSFITKFTRPGWIGNLRTKSRKLFTKYLLLTNTAISVGFSGTGDVLQQNYDRVFNKRTGWDAKRTRNIAISGLVIGPLCHFWYQYLDKALPGTTLRVVLRKVFLDQIVMSPVGIFTFLSVVGYSEGSSRKQITQELLRDKGPDLLLAEWFVWPPIQMINFFVLPTRFRVLYDNVMSLGFDVYYSYVKHREEENTDEHTDLDHDCENEVMSNTSLILTCSGTHLTCVGLHGS